MPFIILVLHCCILTQTDSDTMKAYLAGSVLLCLLAISHSQLPNGECIANEAQRRVLDFVSACGYENINDVSALTLVT